MDCIYVTLKSYWPLRALYETSQLSHTDGGNTLSIFPFSILLKQKHLADVSVSEHCLTSKKAPPKKKKKIKYQSGSNHKWEPTPNLPGNTTRITTFSRKDCPTGYIQQLLQQYEKHTSVATCWMCVSTGLTSAELHGQQHSDNSEDGPCLRHCHYESSVTAFLYVS